MESSNNLWQGVREIKAGGSGNQGRGLVTPMVVPSREVVVKEAILNSYQPRKK